MNINDPEAVKSLLEQLRSSEAWREVAASASENTSCIVTRIPDIHPELLAPTELGGSVASLLSQLKAPTPVSPPAPAPVPLTRDVIPNTAEPSSASQLSSQPSRRPISQVQNVKDNRSCTFQQALPLLAQFGDDAGLIDALLKMKNEQDELERRLSTDRFAIQKGYEEKVKIAKIKAAIIGTVLSKHEAEKIADSFKKDLYRFDHEKVLPMWDGLIARQQTELADFSIPAMFVSNEKNDRQLQLKIMNVLEGILAATQA